MKILCINDQNKKKKVVLGIILGFSFVSWSFSAEALTPTEKQELLDKSRQTFEERENIVNQKDVRLQGETGKEEVKPLPQEAVSFQIDKIVLEGDSVDRFGWAQRLLDQYAGQQIGSEGLNIILKEVTDGFISRGFVTTRVQVGEQDLSTGILRIQLIPGRIRNIRFDEKGQQGSWWTAFPMKSGRILNLRDLEQGLEQMKRVPSQEVKMDLAPGDQPGESDVVIHLEKKKAWRFSLSADDSGSESTGKYQGTVGISVDNVFQHNDLFSYNYTHDLDKHSEEKGNDSHSYFYSMPYGYWTFSFTATPSKYHQTAQGVFSDFKVSGESQTYTLKSQRVIHRDSDSKVTADFQIGRKFSKTFIEDEEIDAQRKNTTYAELGISRRKNFTTGLVDMRLAGRKGVPWLGGDGNPDPMPDDLPTNEYFLGTLDINLVQQFKWGKLPMRYTMDFRGQATSSLLYGDQTFSIGNRYTVRGFDGEYTLSAENGFYIRNELSVGIEKAKMEFYVGLDYGQVTGPSAKYLIGNKLAGTAVGVRGGDKGMFYDVFAAFPIYKPQKFEAAGVTYGFQVGYQY